MTKLLNCILVSGQGMGVDVGVPTSNLEWNADYSVRRIPSFTPDICNESPAATPIHFSKPTFAVT